jgi:hypothetical protein
VTLGLQPHAHDAPEHEHEREEADQGMGADAIRQAVVDRRDLDVGFEDAKAAFDDPLRAAKQGDRRRARIAELEAMADRMVGKLNAQDGGQTARGRRASDRGAYSRFTRAVAEAELTRFIKADLTVDRLSWSVDDAAVARAELLDGKLALITNAPDLTAADAVARYKDLADMGDDQAVTGESAFGKARMSSATASSP